MKRLIFFLISLFAILQAEEQMCGITPKMLGDPKTLQFYKPVNFFTPDFFKKTLLNYSFKCPDYTAVKEVQDLLKKYNKKPTVYLWSINFKTGDYECRYYFDKNVYVVSTQKNTACVDDLKRLPLYATSSRTGLTLKELNYNFPKVWRLGFISFEEPFDFTAMYHKLYKEAKAATLDYYNELKKVDNLVDLNSINSHTNFTKTLASFLTGIITLDSSFIDNANDAVDGFGNINFITDTISDIQKYKDMANTYTGEKPLTDSNELLQHLEDKSQLIDKKFWGFYYYFFKNIEIAFSDLVKILFGIGAVTLFGAAGIMKKLNTIGTEDRGFEFDFTKRFIGLVTAFTIFTAPVIPDSTSNNIKVSEQYIYQGGLNGDRSTYSTIAQQAMRFFLQTGNYFGNYLNDFAFFSYLTYIKKSVAQDNDPELLIDTINKRYVNLGITYYDIYKKYNFFNSVCQISYFNTFWKYNGLPANANANFLDFGSLKERKVPENTNKQYLKNIIKNANYLGNYYNIDYVNYNICSNLYYSIQKETVDFLKNLTDFVQSSYAYIEKQKELNAVKIENINKFLSIAIKMNNSFGWLSVIAVPPMDYILRGKNTLDEIDYELYAKDTLYKKDFNINYINNIAKKYENDLDKIDKRNTTQKALDNVSNDYVNASQWLFDKGDDAIKDVFGTMIEYGSYFGAYMILPGFSDTVSSINKFLNNLIVGEDGETQKNVGKLLKIAKIAKKIAGIPLKLAVGVTSFLIFIVSYLLAIALYVFLITIITLLITSLIIILKIILYFLQMFIVFLISYAMVLWTLVVNQEKGKEAIGNFTFELLVLMFSPIFIVLSVYAVVISDKLLLMLYDLMISASLNLNYEANSDLQSFGWGNVDGFIQNFSLYAIKGAGHIILEILLILLNVMILFKFSDWALELFGKKTQSGVIGETGKLIDSAKQRFGAGMV